MPNSADSIPTRIVAIGASAGGLEPFERFFDAMPADNGLAFVVIQHLSPNFKSMMDELLTRHSQMAIHRIEEGTVVEPNAIYLNQPRLVPTISGGCFKITDTSASVDPNLPINAFFESLALERGPEAIGVVLSGTGSDGTKGCEAIKRAGGAVLVQEPETAKFDGMPNSVINKQLADCIAEPEILASLVLRHCRGENLESLLQNPIIADGPIDYIFALLVDRYGTDFRFYKPTTIERRIRRRYEMCGLNNYQDYADMIGADTSELAALYNDLLIDVTAFFRDGEAFEALSKKVVHEVGARMSDDNQVRIWVPACSSGEEPYSIAMLFADYARENDIKLNLKILATDLHHRSLDAAGAGVYPEESMKSISSERVGRYFDKQGSYYNIRPEIRRLVVFTPHSLFRDPPFTRMDLVSCRNMLIYFKEPAQNKAMALFHFALNKNGFLFLGPSETVGKIGHEFETVDQRWRIYRKTRDVRLVESTTLLRSDDHKPEKNSGLPANLPSGGMRDGNNIRPETRRAYNEALQTLLSQYAPAGFLVNISGQLMHTFGKAGKFISVQEGNFSQNLGELIHDDLKLALNVGLERLKTHLSVPFKRRTMFKDADGETYGVTINIESLPDSTGGSDFLLVAIVQDEEAKPVAALEAIDYLVDEEATLLLKDRIRELERDLSSTEESLQTTIEELETSNEELQATNEELMASNEELQSTNEELHSVNEELYTVSAEHQRKIEELTDLTSDMDQLLKSTEIGTVFLDEERCVRRFTPAATKTFNLIAQDLSRPLSHITHNFGTGLLEEMLSEVESTGKTVEKEVQANNCFYLLRILPYTPVRDGPTQFVIAAIDINDIRLANKRVEDTVGFYKGILQDIAEFVIRWKSSDGEITFCNQAYANMCGMPAADVVGSNIYDMFDDKATRDEQIQAWRDLEPGDTVPLRIREKTPDGHDIVREGSLRAIGDDSGRVVELQSTSRDATQDIKYLESLEALIDTTQSADSDYSTRIDQFLKTGCDFFGLEHGMLQRFENNIFTIENYRGSAPKTYKHGKSIPMEDSLCVQPVVSGGVMHVHDVPSSVHFKKPAIKKSKVKAYIGAPVFKDGDVYGSVSFFSSKAVRTEPFLASQVSFILLLARWIGYKLERREQLLKLQQNEEELKFIFDSVPARIWYKDDQNGILRINGTAAKSMNLSVDEAQGANTYDLFPEMAKKYHDDDLQVLNAGEPRHGIIEEYKPLDGEHGWVSTDKIPFINPQTNEQNLLVVSTDVTPLKMQEIALKNVNLELEQANDGLRQFAYVASHDMQEPLRKIQQFSELLGAEYSKDLDDDGQYFLSVVSESAGRMSGLIKDLLSYSKTSHAALERTDVDLTALMEQVTQSLAVAISEAGGDVSVGGLPIVAGDKTMLEQLFSNLVGNAIKYRDPDRPPRVRVSSRKSKDHITLIVDDNGIGMDSKYLERIFEPFTRLQSDEETRGSGIGLAICKSVCDRHGWQLDVDSQQGEGSRFAIKIPS